MHQCQGTSPSTFYQSRSVKGARWTEAWWAQTSQVQSKRADAAVWTVYLKRLKNSNSTFRHELLSLCLSGKSLIPSLFCSSQNTWCSWLTWSWMWLWVRLWKTDGLTSVRPLLISREKTCPRSPDCTWWCSSAYKRNQLHSTIFQWENMRGVNW